MAEVLPYGMFDVSHSAEAARRYAKMENIYHRYYEKDEARHVGLGTQLLPTLMKRMGLRERVEFSAFSFKIAAYSMASLKGSERDLRTLGIDPRRVAVLGKSKQMMVFDELWQLAPDAKSDVGERLGLVFDAVAEAMWPDESADPSLSARARRVLRTLSTGYETTETVLDPGDHAAAAE